MPSGNPNMSGYAGSTTSKGAEKTSSGMVSGASKGAVGGYSGGGAAVGGKSSGPGGAGGVRNTSTGTRQASTSAAVGGKQSAASSPGGKQSGPGGAGGVRSTSGGDRQSATAAAVGGGGIGGGDRGGKGGAVGGGVGGGGLRAGDPGVAGVPGGLTGRGAPVGGGVGPSGGGQGGLGRIGGPPVANTAMGFQGLTGVAPGPAPGPNQRSRSPGPVSGGMPVSGVPRAAPSPGLGSPQPIGGGINIGPFGRATDPTEGAMTAMADMGMPMAPGYTPGAYSPSPGVPGSMPSASRLDNTANFNVVAGQGAPDTFSGPNTYGGLTMGLPDDSYAGLSGENQPRAPKDQDSLAEVNAPHPVARDPTYDATTGPYGAYNPAGLGAPGMGAYGLSPRQGVPQAPMASLTDFNAPAPSDEPDMAEMQREFDRARALTNQSRQRGWADAAAGAPDLSRQAFEDRGVPTPSLPGLSQPAYAQRGVPSPMGRQGVAGLDPGTLGDFEDIGVDRFATTPTVPEVATRAPEPGGYSNPPRSFANIPQRAPPVAGPGYTNPARSFANIPQPDAPDILSPTQLSSGYTMRGLTPQPGVPSQPPTDVADVPQPGPPQVLSGQPQLDPIDDLNQAPAPGGYMDAARANKWAGEPRAYPRGVPDTQAERIAANAIAGGIGTLVGVPGLTTGFVRGTGRLSEMADAGELGNRPGQPYATGSNQADAKAVGGKQEGRYGSPGTKKSKAERDRDRLAKAIDEWNWTITDNPLPTSATF